MNTPYTEIIKSLESRKNLSPEEKASLILAKKLDDYFNRNYEKFTKDNFIKKLGLSKFDKNFEKRSATLFEALKERELNLNDIKSLYGVSILQEENEKSKSSINKISRTERLAKTKILEAKKHLSNSDYSKAEQSAKFVISIDPNNKDANDIISIINISKKSKDYENSSKLNQTMLNKAKEHIKNLEYEEAEKAAKFVISMDKDNNEALDILKAIEVYKDEPKGKGIYIDFNKKR